nr:MAG TPA: chromosome segregation protein [Podoviridae sp. ctJ6o53]
MAETREERLEKLRASYNRWKNTSAGSYNYADYDKEAAARIEALRAVYNQQFLPQQANKWARDASDFAKKISADAQARSKGYQSPDSLKAYQDSISPQLSDLIGRAKYAQQYAGLNNDAEYGKSVNDTLSYLNSIGKSLQNEQAYWAQWANEDAYKKSGNYYNDTYGEEAKNYDGGRLFNTGSLATPGQSMLEGNDVYKSLMGRGKDSFFDQLIYNSNTAGGDVYRNKADAVLQMSDDERRMYSYLLDKKGKAEADEYYNSISSELAARAGKHYSDQLMGLAGDSQFLKDVLSGLYSVPAGVQNAYEGLGNAIASLGGKTLDPSVTQATHGYNREQTSTVGGVISDLGFTTGNMLPAWAAGALTGTPYTGDIILGLTSAGNSYADAKREGYDQGQAMVYGLVNGTLEAGMQYLLGGISNLGGKAASKLSKHATSYLNKLSNAGVRAVLQTGSKLLTSMGSEATEEYLQSVLDPLVRNIILGEDNDFWAGFTSEDALYSALLGALSAGLLEGPGIITSAVEANKIGKRAFENGSWKGALDYAMQLDPESEPYKLAKALSDGTIKADGNNVGNLYTSLSEYMAESKKLVRKGKMTIDQYTSTAAAIDTIYQARLAAQQQSTPAATETAIGTDIPSVLNNDIYQEVKAVETDEKAAVREANIIARIADGDKSVTGSQIDSVVKTNAKTREIVASRLDVDLGNTNAEARRAVKQYMDTVSSTKTETAANTNTQIAQTETASTAPKTEEETRAQAIRQEADAITKTMGTEGQAVYKQFTANMKLGDSLVYATEAMFRFYNQGVNAENSKHPSKKFRDIPGYEGISAEMKQAAYNAGRVDVQAKSGSIAEIVTKTKETAEKVAQQQAEIKKNAKASKVNIKELAPSAGKWSVDPKIDMDTLTTKQTAAVSYLKAVSEVSGINITLMSGVDVTGEFSVENGHYDGVTNTLYVSVNAGMQSITDITGSAILKTASHEITHYIAASGTQTYSLLEDYVLSRFTEQYGEKSVDNRIEDIQEQYRDQVGKELTREQAKEEMVAAACEMMLKNSEVFEKLARQNLSLAQRIKAGLDGFIKKLSANRKAAFENLDATSPEARAIAASETSLKETQKLWDNALKGAIKENEGGKSAGPGSMSEIRSYDYSKTFAQQIDDYKAGKFPKYDTLIVGATPEVFQKIGLNALPMTYATGHLKDVLQGNKVDHNFGEANLKRIPEAMKNPVAIIASNTKPQSSIVAILDLSFGNKPMFVAVEIEGYGTMNGERIDSNAITSIHTRTNAAKLLADAITNDSDTAIRLFYLNKKSATALFNASGVQFPGGKTVTDGYIHSIRDAGSFVNTKFENVTQTQQFKRWFGDWQKNPKRASKVVNADGTPRVMYHYTDSTFTVFDPARSGSNQGMRLGDGIYISSSKTAFMDYGKNRMDVYADIKHPFEMKLTKAQADEVLNTYAATKHNLDAYGGVYRKHAQQKLMTPTRVMDYLSEYAADNGIKTSDILKHLGYDGIHDGIEWVAFDPTQIKSATDNIGTFDRNNPDIRYELRDNQGRELTKAQAEKFKDSQVRDKDGRLKTVYHGSSAVFNVFSADFMSQHGSSEGQGFYFTDYKDMAEGYQKKGGQLLEGYLNITNPLSDSEVTLSAPEVKRLLKALDPTGDDVILNYDSQGGMGYPSKAWYNRALTDTVNMIMSTSESDSEILAEIANAGAGSGNVMDTVRKVLGYDGYIVEGKYDNANVYVAFGSDQFKSFDNKTPTSSPDIHLELRSDENQFNPRKELSNLFMEIAQNEQETKSLRSYQAAIHELNNTEIEISKLQQEMQGTDKLKSPQKYYELQNKLRQAEAKLNRYDGRLVQLEATKPMKDLIARREQRLKEQFARSSTTRAKYRNNIKKNIRSLDKKLRTNSGQKHVLLELQPVVAQLLNVFTENTSVFKKEQLAKLREIYAKFNPEADSKMQATDNDVKRWKSTAEYSSAYSEMIYDLIEEVRPLVQGKRLIDLDTELLAAVNDIVSNINKMVNQADEMFIAGRAESLREISENTMRDMENSGYGQKRNPRAETNKTAQNAKSFFSYKNAMPVYVFERLGDTAVEKLWDPLQAAAGKKAREEVADREYWQGLRSKYNHKSWDNNGRLVQLESGRKIYLTPQEVMSIYALDKREATHRTVGGKNIKHLQGGGISFPEAAKITVKEANGKTRTEYRLATSGGMRLTEGDIKTIVGLLTQEQRAYADDVVKYLSTTIADRGNAVSRELYGINIFNETYYFPITVNKTFLQQSITGQADKLIKNAGMTKSLTQDASKPVDVMDFDRIVAQHLLQMEGYDTLSVPLDNFQRWLRYQSFETDAKGKRTYNDKTVSQTLTDVYGKEMQEYINNFLTDVNAASSRATNDGLLDKAIGIFKKNAVLASLSVAIQQPSAIGRALLYIDPKYFVGEGALKSWSKANLEEMIKYSDTAFIKENGAFDPAVSRGALEKMLYEEPETVKEKIKALISKDSTYRDNIAGWLPGVMDSITWRTLWMAIKNETADAHPELSRTSEEFLQIAGKRMDYVVNRTQVYDSMLSKSELMRSKSALMKMTTAFMNEPTTTYNMLYHAAEKLAVAKGTAKKAAAKHLARAVASFVTATALNALLKSLVTAARKDNPDDEDGKTYIEWYAGEVVGNFFDDLNPIKLLPVLRDVFSLIEGYDVERSDMESISKLIDAGKAIVDGNASLEKKLEKLLIAVGVATGIPLENLIRDTKGLRNVIMDIADGWQTTAEGVGNAAKSGLPFAQEDEGSINDKLFRAYMNQDETAIKRYEQAVTERFNKKKSAGGYTGYDSAEYYIRKEMRSRLAHTDEIKAVYDAAAAGDLQVYKAAVKALTDKGFKEIDVLDAKRTYANNLKKAAETPVQDTTATEPPEEETVIFDSSMFTAALENNDGTDRQIIEQQLEGLTPRSEEYKDKAAKLKSRITAYLKPKYQDAFLANDTATMLRISRQLQTYRQYGIVYNAEILTQWRKAARTDRK